jgi:hypothetical protein
MKNILRISLVIAAFIFPAFTITSADGDSISWSANRKLTWKDFKGKPYNLKTELAITDYSISYTIHLVDQVLRIVVKNCFSPNTSWAGDTIRKVLLVHEQGHFDLAEIYARKMRQVLRDVKFKFDSVSLQFNKIYTSYYDQLNKEQDAYDIVTEYSENILEQKKFSMRIDSTLKLLDAYKDTVVEVKLVK